MRLNEVVIGNVYETRIGDDLAAVVVVRMVQEMRYSGRDSNRVEKTLFVVRRVGETASLPKHRSAAKLHQLTGVRAIQNQNQPAVVPQAPAAIPVSSSGPVYLDLLPGVVLRPSKQYPENIEVLFPSVPAVEVRNAMKAQGFRWHGLSQCWYGRKDRIAPLLAPVAPGASVPTGAAPVTL